MINSNNLTLDEQIDRILINDTIMQENIKLMKKLYKYGKL